MKLFSKSTFAILAGVALIAGAGCSRNNESSSTAPGTADRTAADRNTAADRSGAMLSSTDKDFAMKAAQGGMAEVALGNLAQQQGSSSKVKDFGKKLANDHSKANDELTQIASREGITLPTSMDSKHQETVDRFAKVSGAKFDREFLKDAVNDHKEDIAEFQKEASQGTDPGLKDFASSHVSVLQDHLDTAMAAQKTVK